MFLFALPHDLYFNVIFYTRLKKTLSVKSINCERYIYK